MPTSSLSSAQREAARRRAEGQSDYLLGRSRVNQDYRQTQGALGRALVHNVADTNDDFASRGMFNSGIRQGEVSDIGANYAEDMGAANINRTRELENLGRARVKNQNNIQTGMESSLFGSTGESLASILQRALNSSRNRIR